MKKVILIIISVGFMFLQANAITGIGVGVHVGQISNYSYSVLTDSLRNKAQQYNLSIYVPRKTMTLVGAHINVGTFPILDFTGFLDYAWNKTNLAPGIDLRLSDFSFGVTAKKKIDFPVVKPYAGAGIAWHRLVYSLDVKPANVIIAIPDNQTKMGYHLVGGLEADIPAFPLVPYLEYRYNWVSSQTKITKFANISLGVSLSF